MRRRRVPVLLVALFGLVVCPSLLSAQQPLSVLPRRDLNFGDVIAGFPTTVTRFDNARSGWLEVRGQANAEVVFTFTLPTTLLGVTGATMPIQFGPNDGGFSTLPFWFLQIGFDPSVPLTRDLSFAGRAYLWLGGTVIPAPNQASGLYQAPVTLTVAYTGN